MSSAAVTCPAWEYKDTPDCETVLRVRTAQIMRAVYYADPITMIRIIRDTRRVHELFFAGLTPTGFEYYAGNYRGSDHICLRSYEVMIAGDPRVGHLPGLVSRSMSEFIVEAQDTLSEIDRLYRISENALSKAGKLIRCAQLLAALFVYFLEIHPYANGNGHMGRLILIAGFRRQGLFVLGWPLHPRPADPPYSDAIKQYRSGNKAPLERFILSCL
jgi:hypothetical protein